MKVLISEKTVDPGVGLGGHPHARHPCRHRWTTGVALALAAVAPATGSDIVVDLVRPTPFEPVMGEVVIEAVAISDEPIARVVFSVDGVVVGERSELPFRWTTTVAGEGQAHEFSTIAYGVSGATGHAAITTPQLRIDAEMSVELQQLYVTVTRDGARVSDLDSEAFAILDEGRRQEIVTFARGDVPFTAAVLVDASVSMKGEKLRAALRGANAFFAGMKTLDQGQLLVFSDRILHSTEFTSFPEVLEAGLGQVEARGGTALTDHLYLALKRLEARQGRRVVVLLTDGVDSHSVLSMSEVVRTAPLSQALVYWLQLPYRDSSHGEPGILPPLTTPWRSAEEHQREFEMLHQVVERSGGRSELLHAIEDVESAFVRILDDLRTQYVLGYYPHDLRHDGRWREVEVEVEGPGRTRLEVRSQEGYIDY